MTFPETWKKAKFLFSETNWYFTQLRTPWRLLSIQVYREPIRGEKISVYWSYLMTAVNAGVSSVRIRRSFCFTCRKQERQKFSPWETSFIHIQQPTEPRQNQTCRSQRKRSTFIQTSPNVHLAPFRQKNEDVLPRPFIDKHFVFEINEIKWMWN